MRIYIDADDTTFHFRRYAMERGVPEWHGSWYTTERHLWTDEQKHIQACTNALMERDDFWCNLPVWERAHELIAAAQFKGEVFILTALPSGVPSFCHELIRRQKIAHCWQQLHVPPERVICCARADKVRYAFDQFAATQNVLIDDAIQNCREWIDANGIAYHFDGDM